MIVTTIESARLNEMKNRLSVQPEPAKKPYRRPVMVIVKMYIAAVDPMRIHCQKFEPVEEFSQLSRHVSDHEWAKSTRRTRPRRMKRVAPIIDT